MSRQIWEYRERHSRNLSSASRRDMLRAYLLLIFCRLISKPRRGARALFLNLKLSVGLDWTGGPRRGAVVSTFPSCLSSLWTVRRDLDRLCAGSSHLMIVDPRPKRNESRPVSHRKGLSTFGREQKYSAKTPYLAQNSAILNQKALSCENIFGR